MDNKNNQQEKIIKIINECDGNLNTFENFIKNNDINLRDCKEKFFDILIYAIEKDLTPEIIEFIIKEGNYRNLNYTLKDIDFSIFVYSNTVKIPLFEAIACENFKVADVLLDHGANLHYVYDSNKNIGDYLQMTQCINKKTISYLNMKDCLRYIVDENLLLKNVNNEKIDELKMLFDYVVYDNTFILSLLNLYKNRTCLTSYQLKILISSQKNKLKITNKVYRKAINNSIFRSFAPVQLLYLYDGSSKEFLYYKTKKNEIFNYAIEKKNKEIVWRILYNEFLNSKSSYFVQVINFKESESSIGKEAIILFIDQLFRHPKKYVINNHSFEFIVMNISKYKVKDLMIYLFEKLSKNSQEEKGNISNLNLSLIEKADSQYLILLLNMAIKINNIELVKYLIENSELKSIKLNLPDRNNEYPLFVALENTTRYNENIGIFEYILSHTSDVTIKDEFGQSLLSIALINKKYKAASLLLKYKESFELNMHENYSPLIKAILQNQLSLVKSFLSKDNFNQEKDEQPLNKKRVIYSNCPLTPITLAYLLDRKDIFTYMLNHSNKDGKKENNKYIRDVDTYGYYLLYYTVLKEDIETFRLLLDYYINVNFESNHSTKCYSIIEMIFSIGRKEMLFALNEKANEINDCTFDLEMTNEYHESPLISLFRMDDSSIMNENFKLDCFNFYINDFKIKIDVYDRNNKPLLFYAMECKKNAIDYTKTIVNINPNSLNNYQKNQYLPIYHAIELNSIPLIKFLHEHESFNKNHSFVDGSNQRYTPFTYSLEVGNLEVIKYFLSFPLNLNFNSEKVQLDIIKILYKRKIDKRKNEIFELLLNTKKLNVDTISSNIIQILIGSENKEFLSILFDHGFNINQTYNTYNHNSLLTYAIFFCKHDIVKFLIEKGIDIGIMLKNVNSMACLEYIIKHNQISTLKHLVQHCHLNVNIRDKKNNNLLNIAIKYRKINIIEYLIKCGTNTDNVNNKMKNLYQVNKKYNYCHRFYYEKINMLLNKAN